MLASAAIYNLPVLWTAVFVTSFHSYVYVTVAVELGPATVDAHWKRC